MATLNASLSPSFRDLTAWHRSGLSIYHVLFRSCPQEQLKRPSVYTAPWSQLSQACRASLACLDLPETRRQCQLGQPQEISSCESKARVLDRQSEVLGCRTTSATNQDMTLTQSLPIPLGLSHPILEIWGLS